MTKRLLFGPVPVPPSQDALDDVRAFDDRTLSSLIGRCHPIDSDEQDMGFLPLNRWDDRKVKAD